MAALDFMFEQLTLAVSLRDDARFANFFAANNQHIIHALRQQLATDGEPFIYLWGTTGVGCSHLLQAACHYADGLGFQSIYLPLDEMVEYGPEVLEGMDNLPLVAIDQLQAVSGDPAWEEGLFHLFNRLRSKNNKLLIAADNAPSGLNIQLPDFSSRLNWGVTYQVQALDDEGKVQALLLRAHRRGLNLSEEVARFILRRGSRNNGELFQLLDDLDRVSLAEQRKLTIPFIKTQLGW